MIFGHIFLKTFEHINQVTSRLISMWQRLKQCMISLWHSEIDAMIIPDPNGLSAEDIRQIKELIAKTKIEKQK